MTTYNGDQWWLVQFARLVAVEEAGALPVALINKWLLLAARTWGNERWCVSFDVPDEIYHVLDDADVRAKDHRYAKHQWAAAREWLNA